MKILLVEDEIDIIDGITFCLKEEGYDIITASTGEEALSLIKKEAIDLVLLDINLPDTDGFQIFEQIKNIPVIFLTANDLEGSIVKCLEMGAEDYITKPFKMRELLARIKVVTRRTKANEANLIKIHDITIDLQSMKVWKKDELLFLTTLEYKILLILAQNQNQVFYREQILADIWDVDEAYVTDNTLTVYIKRIRKKIEDNPNQPKIIKTVRGIGYVIGDKYD